jgi:hypothetical protein
MAHLRGQDNDGENTAEPQVHAESVEQLKTLAETLGTAGLLHGQACLRFVHDLAASGSDGDVVSA